MCGGAARWDRLRELDVPAHTLRGSGLAVGLGAYALPDAPAAIVTAVRLNGVVSHASAAELHGFPLWRPSKDLHVTVASWRPAEPAVKLHRARLLPPDLDTFQPLTSPLRTALDCGRSMSLLEAVVVLDAAMHRGRVPPGALRAAAEAARGHGSAALRQAVRFANALAESPLESVLRLLVTLLPCHVDVQMRVSRAGKVDLVLNGWLVLEADGYEYHSDRKAYREDRRRANVLPGQRMVLLRYTWEDLRFHRWEVLAQIEEVLRMGPPWASATERQGCKS